MTMPSRTFQKINLRKTGSGPSKATHPCCSKLFLPLVRIYFLNTVFKFVLDMLAFINMCLHFWIINISLNYLFIIILVTGQVLYFWHTLPIYPIIWQESPFQLWKQYYIEIVVLWHRLLLMSPVIGVTGHPSVSFRNKTFLHLSTYPIIKILNVQDIILWFLYQNH